MRERVSDMDKTDVLPPPLQAGAHITKKKAEIFEKAETAAEGGLKNSECMETRGQTITHGSSLFFTSHAEEAAERALAGLW